jgi:hypothetical protein
MDKTNAVRILRKLHAKRGDLIKAYSRKRSWKPSERAVAIADVEWERTALDFAIKQLMESMP